MIRLSRNIKNAVKKPEPEIEQNDAEELIEDEDLNLEEEQEEKKPIVDKEEKDILWNELVQIVEKHSSQMGLTEIKYYISEMHDELLRQQILADIMPESDEEQE